MDLHGWVKSANLVDVRMTNLTGGTLDPGDGTIYIKVFKPE